jgi:antitoxin ChpS
MLAIPPTVLEAVDLTAGAAVAVSVDEGRIVVEPRARRRYTLDELLAQCDRRARRSRGDKAWVSNRPVGRELL